MTSRPYPHENRSNNSGNIRRVHFGDIAENLGAISLNNNSANTNNIAPDHCFIGQHNRTTDSNNIIFNQPVDGYLTSNDNGIVYFLIVDDVDIFADFDNIFGIN